MISYLFETQNSRLWNLTKIAVWNLREFRIEEKFNIWHLSPKVIVSTWLVQFWSDTSKDDFSDY